MAELAATLMAELHPLTKARHVDRHWIDDRLGGGFADGDLTELEPSDPRSLRLSILMDELEGEVEHLVYETDRLDSGWTRRCVQMADELILVGLAGERPTASQLERQLTHVEQDFLRPHTTLALIHEGSADPSATGAWLEGRSVDAVQHLRVGRRSDYARLARFCSGQAVGLVLRRRRGSQPRRDRGPRRDDRARDPDRRRRRCQRGRPGRGGLGSGRGQRGPHQPAV